MSIIEKYNYLDLFAGAGGLSEGFIRAGFNPIVHVEQDEAACYTLQTRQAYHWLCKNNKINTYDQYCEGRINRDELYASVPKSILRSVVNSEISYDNLDLIFDTIDGIRKNSNIDIVVGGPPCQAYSLVGRSRDKNNMLGDERNYLYMLYAEFLKKYKPYYFVFENVTGLLSAKDYDGRLHFDKMKEVFVECGYSVEHNILDAREYGVLQSRKRLIIIGKKGNHVDFYPSIKKNNLPFFVEEILKDLPKLKSGEGHCGAIKTNPYVGEYLYKSKIKENDRETTTLHSARANNSNDLHIYRIAVDNWNTRKSRLKYTELPKKLQTHRNLKSFLDRYKVVAADLQYSHTVVAHIAKDGHYYIHPDINQNRSLTPREVARLQTFPDNYHFESISPKPSRTAAYKQIGNAVPVLMAEQIANSIKYLMDKEACYEYG